LDKKINVLVINRFQEASESAKVWKVCSKGGKGETNNAVKKFGQSIIKLFKLIKYFNSTSYFAIYHLYSK